MDSGGWLDGVLLGGHDVPPCELPAEQVLPLLVPGRGPTADYALPLPAQIAEEVQLPPSPVTRFLD